MPRVLINDVAYYYEESGTGNETIVFAHGLLWSGRLYDAQISILQQQYRCIAIDFRGQGRSEVTANGYDMDTLTNDVLQLIKTVVGQPVHFVGLSMGGFVGMRLAIRHPEWLRSLSLLNTSADAEPKEALLKYKVLPEVARLLGLNAVKKPSMNIMFGQTFLHDPSRKALKAEMEKRLLANDKDTIGRAIKGVFSRQGVYEQLSLIRTPTLIIAGEEDKATIPAKSRRMHAAIVGSELLVIPCCGHTSTVEEPVAVTAAISGFLARLAHR